MNGLWGVVVPEAGRNRVFNPSAERAGNFVAYNSATITRDTTQARFGDYSYKSVPGGTNRGIDLTLEACTNAIHYVTFYVYGTVAGTLQASLDSGSNFNAAAVVGGSSGAWVRYGVSIPAVQANASVLLRIRDTANETLNFDGFQVEPNSYFTTYTDGDQLGLYRWVGQRHASASTRDAQERTGGQENDLLATYNISVLPPTAGMGMPRIANNTQPMALQPGELFQSFRALPRLLDLQVHIEGTTWALYHHARQQLINLIRPDGSRGAQPVIFSYSGAAALRKVYCAFHYDGGLEKGRVSGFTEDPLIHMRASDPTWYEDNQETASLTLQQTVPTSNYGDRRNDGLWQSLGSGFDSSVHVIAVDAHLGRIYFGGNFVTANGVTVNQICYWDGQLLTFVAMDAGVNNNTVECIAIAPNGDVWVGGAFTAVGSGAAVTKGLARWNVASSTWTAFNVTTTTFTSVNALAVDTANNLYIGGTFTGWAGVANAKAIAKYDGSTWTALGTGITGAGAVINSIIFDLPGNVWVGGDFTTGDGVTLNALGYWNGTTFISVGGISGGDVEINALLVLPDGRIVVTGSFDTIGGSSANSIAVWDGSQFVRLGSGLLLANGFVAEGRSLAFYTGLLYVGGDFFTAGVPSAGLLAIWNGYTWTQIDILPRGPVYALGVLGSDLYFGVGVIGGGGPSTTSAAQTNVGSLSTTTVFPKITLIGPSTANTTCLLQWLENQSSAERQFYNLQIQAGETATIDERPNQQPVSTDWRGPVQNQPAMSSDDFHLLPGNNIIAAYVSGTQTGVALLAHWLTAHWSADGPA